MTPAQLARAKQLFEAACRLPRGERTDFVDRQMLEDSEVLATVRARLAEADRGAPGTDALSPEGPGTRIGPYKLLQQIGEGGFGAVFMAEQEHPVTRKVALKIIKLGMDTRQVVARFEQERQALAMMDHPNIARVLDAGATATGRPYFVMDLVKGAPIVEYCDRNNLTIDERLELFAQVCGAVQHAHGKGIIHRDLKPSNILVGTQDGKPQAKVIDFGIAKATNSKLTDKTLFTEHQQIIGTLVYMSPEQAEGSLDIDTRSDVYSLGVLLYELLTGSTPFGDKTAHNALYGELVRMIREVDPPRPSTRLGDSRTTLTTVAARRRVEPKRLGALIRGELDWIVMKALEKDRMRRYETANGLAMDIRRYRAGEAVVAAPTSATYRLFKFVRRNKGLVAALSAIAASLLVGVVAFAWQADVARGERDNARAAQKAEAAQREIADEQRALAEAQRAEAKARADELKLVAEFQAGMLEQIDPTQAGLELTADVAAKLADSLARSSPPVAEAQRAAQVEAFQALWRRVNATDVAREMIDKAILQPAIATIDKQFQGQPLVDAKLRQALATRYRDLGLFHAAEPLQSAALATRERVLGDEHPDTLSSICETSLLLKAQARLSEAERYARKALEKRRRVLGEEHPDTLTSLDCLSLLLQEEGKLAEAEPLCQQALEMRRRVLGEEHRDTLISINNMGLLLMAQGKRAEAEPYYRQGLEKSRRLLGEWHKDTLVSINNMGYLLYMQGKLAEAEPFFREALEKRRRVLGEQHEQTLTSLNNLGMLLQSQDKLNEAEPILRETLETKRRKLGEDHLMTVHSVINLGTLLQAQGKLSEAEQCYRRALEHLRRVVGDGHTDTIATFASLASVLREQGRLDEAESLLRLALEKSRQALGEDHPTTVRAITYFGVLRVAQGKHEEAIALLSPIEAKVKSTQAGFSPRRRALVLRNLGMARAGVAKDPAAFALAEANLLAAHDIAVHASNEGHLEIRACSQALVDFYASRDKAEPGQGHAGKAADWKARLEQVK